MAETMNNDPQIDLKNTQKSHTPEVLKQEINPNSKSLDALKMEPLEKSIETFVGYWLSKFYENLNPEQQKTFLETLSKAWINKDNLDQKILWIRWIAFTVWNDGYCFNFPDIWFSPNRGKYDNYASLIESISGKGRNIENMEIDVLNALKKHWVPIEGRVTNWANEVLVNMGEIFRIELQYDNWVIEEAPTYWFDKTTKALSVQISKEDKMDPNAPLRIKETTLDWHINILSFYKRK